MQASRKRITRTGYERTSLALPSIKDSPVTVVLNIVNIELCPFHTFSLQLPLSVSLSVSQSFSVAEGNLSWTGPNFKDVDITLWWSQRWRSQKFDLRSLRTILQRSALLVVLYTLEVTYKAQSLGPRKVLQTLNLCLKNAKPTAANIVHPPPGKLLFFCLTDLCLAW